MVGPVRCVGEARRYVGPCNAVCVWQLLLDRGLVSRWGHPCAAQHIRSTTRVQRWPPHPGCARDEKHVPLMLVCCGGQPAVVTLALPAGVRRIRGGEPPAAAAGGGQPGLPATDAGQRAPGPGLHAGGHAAGNDDGRRRRRRRAAGRRRCFGQLCHARLVRCGCTNGLIFTDGDGRGMTIWCVMMVRHGAHIDDNRPASCWHASSVHVLWVRTR